MKYTKNDLPDWYWSPGLHDAKIISVKKKESNRNPKDNCLILKINCQGAVFETNITEIHFYNYKIKKNDFNINLLNDGWWLSDELLKKDDHYLLDIKFETVKRKRKHLEISFQRAEVVRE